MTDESAKASSTLAAAGLALRLAAIIYEAVLLLGVVFAIGYFLLATLKWPYPLPPTQRALLQVILFVAIGAYFVVSWTRTGQTLALTAWRLKVVDAENRPPPRSRAVARYLLAWHLWLPGLAVASAFELGTGGAVTVLAVTFGILLIPALIDPQRRLLHDLATGTRVVRVPVATKDHAVAGSR